MSTLLNLPWDTGSSVKSNHSNSTESLQDEEEVFPRISEDIFDQLPTRLRQNLRMLQQEAFDRISRTNPNFGNHVQDLHQRPASQREFAEQTPATPSQGNSNSYPTTHSNEEKEPPLAMDEGSSKYLTIRNPDPRGSKSGDGRGDDEEGKGNKRVKFDLPEPEDRNREQHGNTSEAGFDPFQGPVAEENFEYFEDHQPTALETTGPWTASARFQTVLSGETSNPYAPYTSALREEARASVVKTLGELDERKTRKRWFHRFLSFIGLGDSKDKKP